MSFGWCGQILHVDLTRGLISRDTPDPAETKEIIGARGLAAYLYTRHAAVDATAESAANALAFAVSPLTGTLMPNGGHFSLLTRTAAGMAYANLGGAWGPQLKYAGFDAVVITGQAAKPVYLWIHDGEAEIRSAEALWRESVGATVNALRAATAEKARICCIGPAGAAGIPLAALVTDTLTAVAAPGIAPVIAGKNLKAIAVHGTRGIRIAHAGQFLQATQKVRTRTAHTLLHASGARLCGPVLQVAAVDADREALLSEGMRPRGCFGCASIFSTFSDKLTGETLANFGKDSMPHINQARLHEQRAFTDLGLDYVRTKALLSTVPRESGEDDLELAMRLANGELQCAADDGPLPLGSYSGCSVGGYVLVPALERTGLGQDSGVDAATLAAAESAGCCPFAAAAMPAEEIADLLSSATGIDYSPEDVLRAGRRLATAAGK